MKKVYGHAEDATFIRQLIFFSIWIANRTSTHWVHTARCNACQQETLADERHMASKLFSMVMETKMHICCPVKAFCVLLTLHTTHTRVSSQSEHMRAVVDRCVR